MTGVVCLDVLYRLFILDLAGEHPPSKVSDWKGHGDSVLFLGNHLCCKWESHGSLLLDQSSLYFISSVLALTNFA